MRPPVEQSVMCCQAARGPDGLWKGADALVVDSGSANEEVLYSKSSALHIWLLGYEFTDTVVVICSRSIHVLSHKTKGLPAPPAHMCSRECRTLVVPTVQYNT